MSKLTSIANKLSPQESAMDSCPSLPSLQTCVSSSSPVPLNSTEDLQMWLRLDSPASRFQPQANDLGQTINEICGRPHGYASAWLDLDSACLRTFQACLIADTLEPSLETWPRSGIVFDGEFYPQPKWERPTDANDCGLWLTPTATNFGERSEDALGKRRKYRTSIGRVTTPPGGLAEQVRYGKPVTDMFPTPTLIDSGTGRINRSNSENAADRPTLAMMAKKNMWPTPRANSAMAATITEEAIDKAWDRFPNLETVIARQMFPTPTSRDWKSGNASQATLDRNARPLREVVFATPQARDHRTGQQSRWENPDRSSNLNDQLGGQLNSVWVEWLMGWPMGWTNLAPLSLEAFCAWEQVSTWWQEEPADVPRISKGVPKRVDRLKAIGNGQVPVCAAMAWQLLTTSS